MLLLGYCVNVQHAHVHICHHRSLSKENRSYNCTCERAHRTLIFHFLYCMGDFMSSKLCSYAYAFCCSHEMLLRLKKMQFKKSCSLSMRYNISTANATRYGSSFDCSFCTICVWCAYSFSFRRNTLWIVDRHTENAEAIFSAVNAESMSNIFPTCIRKWMPITSGSF